MAGEQASASHGQPIEANGRSRNDANKPPRTKKRKRNDYEESLVNVEFDLHSSSTNGVITPGLNVTDNTLGLWHGSDDRFTVQFHQSKQSFELPKAALIASFEYFKRLLGSAAHFSERLSNSVKFQDGIQSKDFEVLITWLQTGLLKMPRDPVCAITMCISTVIDGDYLKMVNLEEYLAAVKDFLRKTLRGNRTALSRDHLLLMQQKSDLFQTKAEIISTVIAQAAVRPFMTSYLGRAQSGQDTLGVAKWKPIILHYEDLMENDIHYSKNVMTEVRKTLCNGQRRDCCYLRSKIAFENRPFPYSQFDLVRYLDPLFTGGQHEAASYFTI